MRHAGATGQLTMRADSGFYAHAIVAVCRDKDVRFSITVRQHESLRSQIDAILLAAPLMNRVEAAGPGQSMAQTASVRMAGRG